MRNHVHEGVITIALLPLARKKVPTSTSARLFTLKFTLLLLTVSATSFSPPIPSPFTQMVYFPFSGALKLKVILALFSVSCSALPPEYLLSLVTVQFAYEAVSASNFV